MKTLTVRLPEELVADIEEESRGRKVSKSDVVRERLRLPARRTRSEPVLKLMQKYGDVPMSLADACLVRMSEIGSDTVLLTTDADFRIYRRHGRHVVACLTPY